MYVCICTCIYKGLEWEHVYIVRCVSGEMPLSNNVHAPINGLALEEERRLCYVAMTRARSTLLEPTSPGESSVSSATALQYAHEVIAFEAQPQYVREQHKAARTRHFAQSNALAGMENKLPTAKQLAFLKSLGCPLQPKSMMECSALIDKYKKM